MALKKKKIGLRCTVILGVLYKAKVCFSSKLFMYQPYEIRLLYLMKS